MLLLFQCVNLGKSLRLSELSVIDDCFADF